MWTTHSDLAVALTSAITLSGTAVVSALAAVVAGGVAVWSLHAFVTGSGRQHEDLLRPFVAVAAVITLGAVGVPIAAGSLQAGVLSVVPLVTFLLAFVPWNVFAFRYAGRGDLLTRRRVLVVSSLVVVLALVYVSVATGALQPTQESYSSVLLAASTLLLGAVALTFVSGGLVLTAAYRHGNVPLAGGVIVVLPVAVLVIGIQVVSLSDSLTREFLAGLHLLGAAVALPVAVGRYDVLTTRPGTTMLGERTVIEDFGEAVLVVDRDGEIILSNRRAGRLFGADLDGQRLDDLVGADVDTLRESSTIESWTESGHRQFAPRVSTVTGSRDRTLGRTVTLIDVTDLEMLRQRVQVLNRIFRHNIRNDLDVIRANAEYALVSEADGEADEAIRQILETTDDVVQLSAEARRIERLTRNSSTDGSPVNLVDLVESVVEAVTRDRPEVSVTIDVPAVELALDRELLRFALRNLAENAVQHNDGESPRVEFRAAELESEVRIVVADDGPGIPDAEWQIIETGEEEPLDHATSFGLWGVKWAVREMGGDLSRHDHESGAAVVIEAPTESPAVDG